MTFAFSVFDLSVIQVVSCVWKWRGAWDPTHVCHSSLLGEIFASHPRTGTPRKVQEDVLENAEFFQNGPPQIFSECFGELRNSTFKGAQNATTL